MYDLMGYRTASGEILDSVTATAAHRLLPLASFAKAQAQQQEQQIKALPARPQWSRRRQSATRLRTASRYKAWVAASPPRVVAQANPAPRSWNRPTWPT
jgi:hypothetical protein